MTLAISVHSEVYFPFNFDAVICSLHNGFNDASSGAAHILQHSSQCGLNMLAKPLADMIDSHHFGISRR
jgi:hypothetical protein